MIPWFQFTVIPIGPLHIQVWGLCVAIGILLGAWVGDREAKRRGLDSELFLDMVTWMVVGGIIGGRLFHVVAYEPAVYLADPLKVLRIWEGGLSSFGTFAGAALAVWLVALRHHARFSAYMELMCYAAPLTYGCGRVGCFLIHDHPGTLSHSFLAVRYPGGSRLDHGLLLAIVGFALFGWFEWLRRARPPYFQKTGFAPLLMLSYGLVRFLLDFFRAADLPASDVRYLGLTPAQYACLALIIAGAWLLRRRLRNPAPPSALPA